MKAISPLLLFSAMALLLPVAGGLLFLLALAGVPLSELPGLASLVFEHFTQ